MLLIIFAVACAVNLSGCGGSSVAAEAAKKKPVPTVTVTPDPTEPMNDIPASVQKFMDDTVTCYMSDAGLSCVVVR